jgi:hypothetical protein
MFYSAKISLGAVALLAVWGTANVVQAAAVTSFTIQDVGSGTGGAYSPTLDGMSGAFRFSNIDPTTYNGAALFTGDIAAAPGSAPGEIDASVANPAGSFSTGFQALGAQFVPHTTGPTAMDITGNVLTVTSLPWGGIFAGTQENFLPPDAGTLEVHFLQYLGGGDYAYKIGWSHFISADGEPMPTWPDYTAYWMLEGVMHTVPVPAAFWLLGSGLIGLLGVARRHMVR